MKRCSCGFQLFSADDNNPIPCPRCQGDLPPKKQAPRSVACKQWPAWTILVKCCRDKEDVGIGDTIKRMADSIGGERFKRWAEQCGIPCGCTERQEKWNQMYPY